MIVHKGRGPGGYQGRNRADRGIPLHACALTETLTLFRGKTSSHLQAMHKKEKHSISACSYMISHTRAGPGIHCAQLLAAQGSARHGVQATESQDRCTHCMVLVVVMQVPTPHACNPYVST